MGSAPGFELPVSLTFMFLVSQSRGACAEEPNLATLLICKTGSPAPTPGVSSKFTRP
jgi:hypothetical protein